MKYSRIVVAVALAITALAAPAGAVRAPDQLAGRPELELYGTSARVRTHRVYAWNTPPKAAAAEWARFLGEYGPGWRVAFDPATGVPSRIFGVGIPVDGAVASDWVAERAARDFLGRHLALLAPGAQLGDFVLSANHSDGATRSVGFFQTRGGLPVLGGQVSFRFKNDRLFVIASEALPAVAAPQRTSAATPGIARAAAEAWVRLDLAPGAIAGAMDGPFVLPLIGDAAVLAYRTVVRVVVDSKSPVGRWDVFVDAATGVPVARRQTLHFATGTVYYNVPVRYPAAGYMPYPARNANLTADGASVTTDATGLVTWAGAAAASLVTRCTGPLVNVLHDTGAEITGSLSISPGGDATWDRSTEEQDDAQLASFIHTHVVKARAKIIAPDMNWIDGQIQVTVNIADNCNAFSDGDSINFFRQGSGCANTGRLADVVYHEFGHSFHNYAIIPGVGGFGDGSLGEGVGDYLSATITGDPGMGRGFFLSDAPLRHIDENDERVWPDDVGEIHETGIIYAGAMWDLRKNLIAALGEAPGIAHTDTLYYRSIQRSVDIPSTYVETLAADDDDGNLDNGTPNACSINEAFARHGLAEPGAATGVGVSKPTVTGLHVAVPIMMGSMACPGKELTGATLDWRLRGNPAQGGTIPMVLGEASFDADIPPPAEQGEVVNFKVSVTFADGNSLLFPDNAADPWYEIFVGGVTPIFCTDFEGSAAPEGWTHGLTSGDPTEGADDWQWGTPQGTAGSGDPKQAYSGSNVYGNDLGGGNFNGQYQPNKVNYLLTHEIDTSAYSAVRLQYRRWLNVEDGIYDQATIYANGTAAWTNLATDTSTGTTHHADKEWRFHDIDLAPYVSAGKVQLKFEIRSDGGFEMGGWNIDDFCVVGYVPAVCGDGMVGGVEECDDGATNSDTAANACRTDCRAARCGDGVVDGGEQCDDMNSTAADGCENDCTLGGPLVLTCGNGAVDDGEECDDGNEVNDDECSNACRRPPGFDDGGGCGCRAVAKRGGAASGLAAALLLGAIALGIRRRRSR